MTRGLKQVMRRFVKKGQVGQSIVILALGFVSLLSFVGIVTDVSLLFIRASSLRRAVDAAAVAAATQMRRQLDDESTDDIDEGEAQTFENVHLAARQMLQLYGFDPENVKIESCFREATEDAGFDTLLDIDVDDGGAIHTGTSGSDGVTSDEDLRCFEDEKRKLVRVEVVDESPTVFMQLLGINSFPLIEAAISETAVLDVVMIFDVSESMLSDTTYDDWDEAAVAAGVPSGRAPRWVPGRAPIGVHNGVYTANWWQAMLDKSHNDILEYLQGDSSETIDYVNDGPDGDDETFELAAGLDTDRLNPDGSGQIMMDQNTAFSGEPNPTEIDVVGWAWVPDSGGGFDSFVDPFSPPNNFPRPECRTRFWPHSVNIFYGSQNNAQYLNDVIRPALAESGMPSEREYFDVPGALSLADGDGDIVDDASEQYYRFWGWVPTYDYFACCNDPDGDNDFTDLVCQPFRQARDASEQFIQRIDFARGDRVAFVTFDRLAFLVDPDGEDGDLGSLIEEEDLAISTLRRVVGVRAERSFYGDIGVGADLIDAGTWTNDGFWDHLLVSGEPPARPEDYDVVDADVRYTQTKWDVGSARYYATTETGEVSNHPVRNNCPFDSATHVAFFSPFFNEIGDPLLSYMHLPPWTDQGDGFLPDMNSQLQARRSYEYRGACRGGNVGGALAAGHSALNEGNRTEGAVWIMVLLGDGAAGASNPIPRDDPATDDGDPDTVDDIEVLALGEPYARDVSGDLLLDAARGGYGGYGACPYGRPGDAELQTNLINGDSFPYCSDIEPSSRHYCGLDTDVRNDPRTVDLKNSEGGGTALHVCLNEYDTDDFARDWADFVGGIGQEGTSLESQLPIMFTIGFGLTYPNDEAPDGENCTLSADPDECYREANIDMYLGEELMRYIADVGDNFRVDNDYWQWHLGHRGAVFEDPELLATVEEVGTFYGQPGPCQAPEGDWDVTYPAPPEPETLSPRVNCGNYFNAPTIDELELVFNEIASRMFTRLTQ